jgi:hypothetical protein
VAIESLRREPDADGTDGAKAGPEAVLLADDQLNAFKEMGSHMNLKTTRRRFVGVTALAAAAPPAFSADASARPKSIDAWGHVSLPRFMSAEEYLELMDANGVEAAIVGTAATCPNLTELSRTAVRYGNRFRVIGMPSGRTPQERVDCVKAQMDSGFQGIRLQTTVAVREPELLDIIGPVDPFQGRRCGTPFRTPAVPGDLLAPGVYGPGFIEGVDAGGGQGRGVGEAALRQRVPRRSVAR